MESNVRDGWIDVTNPKHLSPESNAVLAKSRLGSVGWHDVIFALECGPELAQADTTRPPSDKPNSGHSTTSDRPWNRRWPQAGS